MGGRDDRRSTPGPYGNPRSFIILADYHLLAKGEIDVEALYREDGRYRYQGGWNMNALVATAVGALFSSILPSFTTVPPSWWGIYGWVFGVAIGAITYLLLWMLPRRPVKVATAA